MIDKNLGNAERLVRLGLGLAFAIWMLMQPSMNGIEWMVMVISLALVLNGVFSRCYLWFVIERSSFKHDGSSKPTGVC
jgi:hypothetical protein